MQINMGLSSVWPTYVACSCHVKIFLSVYMNYSVSSSSGWTCITLNSLLDIRVARVESWVKQSGLGCDLPVPLPTVTFNKAPPPFIINHNVSNDGMVMPNIFLMVKQGSHQQCFSDHNLMQIFVYALTIQFVRITTNLQPLLLNGQI